MNYNDLLHSNKCTHSATQDYIYRWWWYVEIGCRLQIDCLCDVSTKLVKYKGDWRSSAETQRTYVCLSNTAVNTQDDWK